ncbi:hypothetical protein DJ90_5979 [Paenibacillus macerans]|uniref:Uncharacterized protein n=1 Tax=Paenibacillus macerans TaxID=44252 RepID=A0A090Y4Z0_PAEMA|nr:hypothetical protein DJ90_5979 [Paenibacillus macerans]
MECDKPTYFILQNRLGDDTVLKFCKQLDSASLAICLYAKRVYPLGSFLPFVFSLINR